MKKLLLFLFFLPLISLGQKKITYPELINRLVDLEYLAKPPLKGEFSGSFSSYDRNSKYDFDTKSYVNWHANRDGTGYVRKENNNIVVFEQDGPGVIWRVWSALALSGHIKIYIDNQKTPIIDKPFSDFF